MLPDGSLDRNEPVVATALSALVGCARSDVPGCLAHRAWRVARQFARPAANVRRRTEPSGRLARRRSLPQRIGAPRRALGRCTGAALTSNAAPLAPSGAPSRVVGDCARMIVTANRKVLAAMRASSVASYRSLLYVVVLLVEPSLACLDRALPQLVDFLVDSRPHLVCRNLVAELPI